MKDLTANTIFLELGKTYARDKSLFLREVRDAPGPSFTRSLDAMAFGLWPSRGCHAIGFEVKTNRSDWLSELKDPLKAETFYPFCRSFYLVTTPGVAEDHEVPSTWGWIQWDGSRLTTLRPAPEKEPKLMPFPMVASLLKRASESTPERGPPAKQGPVRAITQDERQAIIGAARNSDPQIYTLCLVLAHTGCRISEALSLRGDDVDQANSTIRFETMQRRKRGSFRSVPIPDDVLKALRDVHKFHEGNHHLWLFSRATAWRKVLAVVDLAGVENASPQSFRRSFGIEVLKNKSFGDAQQLLGHSTSNATASFVQT